MTRVVGPEPPPTPPPESKAQNGLHHLPFHPGPPPELPSSSTSTQFSRRPVAPVHSPATSLPAAPQPEAARTKIKSGRSIGSCGPMIPRSRLAWSRRPDLVPAYYMGHYKPPTQSESIWAHPTRMGPRTHHRSVPVLGSCRYPRGPTNPQFVVARYGRAARRAIPTGCTGFDPASKR